jgi:DNA (cytosine-5)-methyltransferase 1
MLTCGSLFAGIGGFDLGFERAGIKTVWQVEIDPFCRQVLQIRFPDARRFSDVRDVGRSELAPVDIISGGFPCQDISHAGRRIGIGGERSGLWSEFARIISELRPRYALVENVAALLGRGIERVLGDLAEIGYDAEWKIISASDVGAEHIRERVWILAYPGREGIHERGWNLDAVPQMPNIRGDGRDGLSREYELQEEVLADSHIIATFGTPIARQECAPWATESGLARVAHGIPNRVDRIKSLGNAIVPQVAEWIGRRIIACS